jgi:hypothetical protein
MALAFAACGKGDKSKESPPQSSGSAKVVVVDAAAAEPAGSGSAEPAGSGSAEPAGSGSAEPAGSGSAAAATATHYRDSEFDKLDFDGRVKFMKEKVVPAMKTAFQKHDPKEFAEFNCKTCHGKEGKEKKFKMPNPDLPELDFAALKAGKQEPEMAKFMAEVVNPDMAKLLGAQPYSDKTPDGFGCLACHVAKQ